MKNGAVLVHSDVVEEDGFVRMRVWERGLQHTRCCLTAAQLRWKKGSSALPISSLIPFRVHKGANGSPMPPPCIRLNKTLELMAHVTQQCASRATKLTHHVHSLHQDLTTVLRCFGRQYRGPGHVFVKLVRQTTQKLLELGEPIPTLGQQAQPLLAQATGLSDAQRALSRGMPHGDTPPCAHPQAIYTAHPRQKTQPRDTRQGLRAHQRAPSQRPEQWPRAVWSQAGERVGACHGLSLRQPGTRGASPRSQRCLTPPGPGAHGDGTRQDTAATPGPRGGG